MNGIAGKLFGTIVQPGQAGAAMRLPECSIDARKCCPTWRSKEAYSRSKI